MKKSTVRYGGQALLEGVMMQGANAVAIAVRDSGGVIRTKTQRVQKAKNIFYKTPVVRGVFYFVRALVTGTKVMADAARVFADDEESGQESMGLALTISVVLALCLTIGLFILLPNVVTNFLVKLFDWQASDLGKNLIEGVVKVSIFVAYLIFIGFLKDIKRVFMYHGAEHRTINAYERGLPLTVENIQKMPTFHPRCGTSFMFFVLIISVIVFSFFGWQTNAFLRLGMRLLMLPLVAGISYEILKLLALSNSVFLFPLKLPGYLLQKLSTRIPDDQMAEVAIAAFTKVRAMDENPEIAEEDFVLSKPLKEVREDIARQYSKAGIDPSGDINWILTEILCCKTLDLREDMTISASKQDKIKEILDRRLTGEPLQYILGYTEFFGLKIKTGTEVLIPRPETELVAELALKYLKEGDKVLDLCTGSGAIAITLAKKSRAKVTASDISVAALLLAKNNARANDAEIEFLESDIFDQINQKFDIIVANPPYIPQGEIASLQKEVRDFEPHLALDGGEDGLDFYRKIARGAAERLTEGGRLILEIGYNQAEAVKELLEKAGFREIFVEKDFDNNDRIVSAIC